MTARAALGEDNGYCVTKDDVTRSASPSKYRQLKKGKEMVPEFERFQLCNDAAQKRAHGIGIYVKGAAAWLGGVIRCNSVWICAVCARRIAELRKQELQEAIDNAVRLGFGVILVTLTFPHGLGDVLATILKKFSKAQRVFKSGKAAVARREKIGFLGEIRTLEVTHGANGWHPHAHSLWILDHVPTQEEMEAIQSEVYQAWRNACLKSGLPEPSKEHGVDVRGARNAAAYVAKWGFAMEIAGGTSKRGKTGSRSPWQLLADATEGDQRAALLWREFALAFFGKRQLFWSRGLRDKLKIAPELTEQELLDLDDKRSQQVAMLDLDTWYCVRKAGALEAVLRSAVDDIPGLYALLNHLRSTTPMEGGRPPPGPREDWER